RFVRRMSSVRGRAVDVRMAKAIEYIRLNACNGISAEDVAREMGCSRRLADLRFREALGHTVFDEIRAVRIERVKVLLAKPGQEVFAIPDLCGYSSLADLCRDFKKRTGQTLRGWRSGLPNR
ncbi:MAG: helix-turn-helix transcriptional regulator, partial [bacterium]|nr:helix-turn-helix transcriptional regulator [Candidatus Colisoma equi]